MPISQNRVRLLIGIRMPTSRLMTNLTNSLQENGQIRILKADLLKQKALKLVEDSVKIKDEDGNEIDKKEIFVENTENTSELSQNGSNPDNPDPKEEELSESDD